MLQYFSLFLSTRLEVVFTLDHLAAYVDISFRYTKDIWTFEQHMFVAIPLSLFCSVLAAARVIKQWSILTPCINTPVFYFSTTFLSKAPHYLFEAQMTFALRSAAILTHSEENHLVHQLIESISTHSLRVFARLYLKIVGWNKEDIAHQLRWSLDAIKCYIRQALFQADKVGSSLFH